MKNPKLTSAGLFFYPILSSTDSRWADPDATTLIRIQNEAGESSFGMWLKKPPRTSLPA